MDRHLRQNFEERVANVSALQESAAIGGPEVPVASEPQARHAETFFDSHATRARELPQRGLCGAAGPAFLGPLLISLPQLQLCAFSCCHLWSREVEAWQNMWRIQSIHRMWTSADVAHARISASSDRSRVPLFRTRACSLVGC